MTNDTDNSVLKHSDYKLSTIKARCKTYDITLEEYLMIEESQNGACLACGEVPKRGLVIDHNHKTHEVRGLICGRCNTAIGLLDEDPEKIRGVLHYLRGFPGFEQITMRQLNDASLFKGMYRKKPKVPKKGKKATGLSHDCRRRIKELMDGTLSDWPE